MRAVVDRDHDGSAVLLAGGLGLRPVDADRRQAGLRGSSRRPRTGERSPTVGSATDSSERSVSSTPAAAEGVKFAAAMADDGVGVEAPAATAPGTDPIATKAPPVTAVSVVQSASEADDAVRRGGGSSGTASPDSRAILSAVSSSARSSGKCGQRSASIPGYCEPSPGNKNASVRAFSRPGGSCQKYSPRASRTRWFEALRRQGSIVSRCLINSSNDPATRPSRALPASGSPTGVERVGEILEVDVSATQSPQLIAKSDDAVRQREAVVGRQQEGLAIPVRQRAGRDLIGRRGMLFKNDVGAMAMAVG